MPDDLADDVRVIDTDAPIDVWWSEMIKRGFVKDTTAEYQGWLEGRALVAEVRELRRVAYVLAMAIFQSDLYENADDELRASMECALPHSLRQEAP